MGVTGGRGSAEDGKQQSALKNPVVATIARRRGVRGIGGGDDKTTDNNDHHDDHDDHDTTIKQCTGEGGRTKMVAVMSGRRGEARYHRFLRGRSSKGGKKVK